MQFRRVVWLAVLIVALLLIGTILGVLVWHYPEVFGFRSGGDRQTTGLWVISATTLVLVMCVGGYHLLGSQLGRSAYRQQEGDDVPRPTQASHPESRDAQAAQVSSIKDHLRDRNGFFWRRKVRLLLVVGEPAQIEAIAPTLAKQLWLEGQGTVLLWGGSAQATLDQSFPAQWAGLSRWRVLDGVVWALDKTQAADDAAMGSGVRQLQRLARGLHWQLPLYLWQVCDSTWSQDTRKAQPVGCLLPPRFDAQALQGHLKDLLEPLRREGLAQINDVMGHDFLLRLSRDLRGEGIARWHPWRVSLPVACRCVDCGSACRCRARNRWNISGR